MQDGIGLSAVTTMEMSTVSVLSKMCCLFPLPHIRKLHPRKQCMKLSYLWDVWFRWLVRL